MARATNSLPRQIPACNFEDLRRMREDETIELPRYRDKLHDGFNHRKTACNSMILRVTSILWAHNLESGRRGGWCVKVFEPVFLEFSIDRCLANAKELCSPYAVAFCDQERLANGLLLKALKGG